MGCRMTSKMQSCVDHIKTSLDVDPWAMELVEQVFTEYDAWIDKVLEIIDKYKNFPRDYNPLKYIRNEIIALKGGKQE